MVFVMLIVVVAHFTRDPILLGLIAIAFLHDDIHDYTRVPSPFAVGG